MKKWLKRGVYVIGAFILLFIGVKSINSLLYKSTGSVELQVDVDSEMKEVATFAGGCFWCMEPPFEKLAGVKSVVSGYTGGTTPNPTYKQVTLGDTGHVEAVQVIYDPSQVSYEELLDVYWRQIDPTDPSGQFVDRGSSYTTAIFYHHASQKMAAEKSKKELALSDRFSMSLVTEIRAADTFYRAEEYHQDYYKKNTFQYQIYRKNSGRDQYLDEVWQDER
ncbi:peptide-methionine (S)-S-oxide reductase MsrA [Hazenella sp. IB182353]|nr:peptide-methionine (S)-S-oxide reductase MsrA [Polycladospora coralii]MBS7529587.1 peptide-methionine (S)-S-oxide reductase MsrA [Polycladospora coralii]